MQRFNICFTGHKMLYKKWNSPEVKKFSRISRSNEAFLNILNFKKFPKFFLPFGARNPLLWALGSQNREYHTLSGKSVGPPAMKINVRQGLVITGSIMEIFCHEY